MKKLLLILSFVTCYSVGKAQAPNWIWAENSNGGDWENGIGLSIDTAGHLYLDGRVNGTVNFGGGSVSSGCGYSNSPFVGEFDSSGTAVWMESQYYSCGNDYTEGFYRDNYDNTYATGIIGSNCCGAFVEKYNASGTLQWPLALGSNSGSSGLGVAADNHKNVYVCGTMSNGTMSYQSINFNYPGSSQSIILLKLDSNGNAIWGKCIYGAGSADGDDQARDIIVDNKGYIYFIGDYSGTPTFGTYTAPTSTVNKNFFLAKYDTAGNEIWVNTVNDAYSNDDFGGTSGLVMDSCGNLYVTGLFYGTSNFGSLSVTSAGGQDMFVARSDNNGNWQWAQSAGGANDDNGSAIAIDKNSDIYVAGYSNSGGLNFGNGVSTTSGDIFVAKYSNGNGAAQWAQSATANSGVGAIAVDKQKYVYVYGSIGGGSATFGSTTLSLSSTQNLVLAKLDTVTSRTIIPIIQASYCPGSTDTIPYTITGTFNSGNTFTVELSDSNGSFVNYTNLGSITSTGDSEIVISIPNTIPTDSNYLIRIVSSNPAASSYFNGCGNYYVQNVYPNVFYVSIGGSASVSVASSLDTVCSGGSVLLSASSGNGATYVWINGTDTIAKTDTVTVYPSANTTYYVNVVSKGGCSGEDSVIVTSKPAPSFVVVPQDTSFCSGQTAILHINGGGSNFIWTPTSGITDSTLSGDSITVSPTATTTYTVIGTNPGNCAASGTDIVGVIPSPGTPTFTQDGDTLISSSVHDNQWYRNDSLLKNDTSQHLIIDISGEYYVVVTNEVNGCSTSSDSMQIKTGINQLSVISSQLSIYPNPFNNDIFIKINSSVGDIKDWNLQITDELGRTVFSRLNLDYSNNIDLSSLSSGIYFITVINKTGRVVVPVVKQN